MVAPTAKKPSSIYRRTFGSREISPGTTTVRQNLEKRLGPVGSRLSEPYSALDPNYTQVYPQPEGITARLNTSSSGSRESPPPRCSFSSDSNAHFLQSVRTSANSDAVETLVLSPSAGPLEGLRKRRIVNNGSRGGEGKENSVGCVIEACRGIREPL